MSWENWLISYTHRPSFLMPNKIIIVQYWIVKYEKGISIFLLTIKIVVKNIKVKVHHQFKPFKKRNWDSLNYHKFKFETTSNCCKRPLKFLSNKINESYNDRNYILEEVLKPSQCVTTVGVMLFQIIIEHARDTRFCNCWQTITT